MTNKQNQRKKETWSPEQLAIMLHASVTKIYEAIENGQLPAQKIEANYVIHREAIEKFLKTGNPFAQRSASEL